MARSFTVARSVTDSLRLQVAYQHEDADEVKARQLEDSYLAALRNIRENPILGLSIKQMPGKFRRAQLAHIQYYLYYIYDESADDVFVFALRHKR
jgi:plasmid stabilization system protein ParE